MPDLTPIPSRNDAVAAWLKRKRDEWTHYGVCQREWAAVDRLLDEYREKADYGLRLDEDGGDP